MLSQVLRRRYRLSVLRASLAATFISLFLLSGTVEAQDFKVLVFSKTAGFRHASIPDGIAMIQQLGAANDFAVDTTEVAGNFSTANLAQYAVVIWLNTTGDVLSATQQTEFESYVESGGAWVGIHSATDTEYDWPWYGELIGGNAWFDSHPADQNAAIHVEDQTHQSTSHWPADLVRFEEWYNFQNNPRASVNVLVTVDESSYSGGNMGADHPISWYHPVGGGRAWYTAMGHHAATYTDADFRAHVLGGILWAANVSSSPTLPCEAAPLGGCIQAAQGRLFVNEKNAGRESVSVALAKLDVATTQSSFGNPTSGSTTATVCVYDDSGTLGHELSVARAGAFCGAKPCWKALAALGYQYDDKSASSDGVTRIQWKSGLAGKGQLRAKAANNASQAETSLVTGLAAQLASSTSVTIQVLTSDASCFSAALSDVSKADGIQFMAKTP